MNVTKALEVVAINAILLLGLYFVTADVAARTTYAAREGLSYFFTQSFLVEMSNLQGRGETLQSPPILAWPQVLLALLVIVDALYLYGWIGKRRTSPPPRAEPQSP